MECLHTHPVLVYFCSIINEQIIKRYQYFKISKQDMYLYTNHQRIKFRWYLIITLSRNRRLIQLRKHQLLIENFGRKRFNSNAVIQNHITTCTTLLLDIDEHDDHRNGSF